MLFIFYHDKKKKRRKKKLTCLGTVARTTAQDHLKTLLSHGPQDCGDAGTQAHGRQNRQSCRGQPGSQPTHTDTQQTHTVTFMMKYIES